MALEELIVAWSKERPAWQREVMRRVAAGEVLSEDDYENLVQQVLETKELVVPQFGLEHLPQAAPEDLPVCILAIDKPRHVNALESKEPLTFEPKGLTIVYGDNGSGKSGYARLLKRITRARRREDVLTDIFRDTSLAKPTAELRVRIGGTEESLVWPESARPEMQRILFYDAACGSSYVADESDFPYRPSALFVMDGLIEACVEVRKRIDEKLAENSASINHLPTGGEQTRESDAGKFLASLSGGSSVDELDELIEKFDGVGETIEQLKEQEANLHRADPTKARQQFIRQSEKLAALRKHIESLDAVIGRASLLEFQQYKDELSALEQAETFLVKSFESEPLPGIGSSAWKELWEAARRFSIDQVYTEQDFPYLGKECRCVLCQQPLDVQSRERLHRFDDFVQNDIQVRLREANRAYENKVKTIQNLTVSPEVVANDLKDLEVTNGNLVNSVREFLTRYTGVIEQLLDTVSTQKECLISGIDPGSIISCLTVAGNTTKASYEEIGHPEGIQKQIAALAARRADLELLEQVKKSRSTILNEIKRLKERDALVTAKRDAATTGITKKILEFSEESITEVVRDTFTRETERLRLERVTIARTRANKGALLHQPKLVGARQQVTLPRVFSEGERTALGLAAFFTEAQLDDSRSAIILDDPVTSLDHVRRGLVASRLVAFAEYRQVILFTHDVAFVADLKREAEAKGILVAERSVTRSRADERKPGVCTKNHPWKAKDVPARLDELRRELDRIGRDCGTWAENQYEEAVAVWSGNLSETWERIFSQEIVGPVLAKGGLEVRPLMVKVIARFSEEDRREFDASYSRVSQWAKRHDKSVAVNYVAPDVDKLEEELRLVNIWHKRVKSYKS